jgi:queuosine biosynthesis protein QueD
MSDDLWQRFTGPATRVVQYAQQEALKLGGNVVSTEHILLGLLREKDSIAARVLEYLGVSFEKVRAELERSGLVRKSPTKEAPTSWSPKAKRVLELALEEAAELNPRLGLPNYIDTEHILLGLIREGEGQAARVLRALKVDLDQVRREVVAQLGGVHEAALRRTPQPRPTTKPPHTGGQPVYELMVETEFSAAHSLEGYEGACAQLHGHNYRVVIELAGNELDHRGMLLDFREVRRIVESFVGELDHQHLNKLQAFESQNPTSENLARHIFHHVAGAIGELEGLGERKIWPVKVTVYESSRSAASYGEPFAQ